MFCELCWGSWWCQLPDPCSTSHQFWGGFTNLLLTLCFRGAALNFTRHSPEEFLFLRPEWGKEVQVWGQVLGFFLTVLTACSGDLCGSETPNLSEVFLWKRSKWYGNVQNCVMKAHLSTSVLKDQKWQSKGHSFPGRSGDMPDTCTELHTLGVLNSALGLTTQIETTEVGCLCGFSLELFHS